ncbi:thioredoxin fold domain-containing protein [Escherichia coli]
MGVREFASKTKSIDYKSPNEKYRLAIFTDITCGYCQKLHHDLKSYLMRHFDRSLWHSHVQD